MKEEKTAGQLLSEELVYDRKSVWEKMNDEDSEGDEDFWLEVGDIEFVFESNRDGLFQFAKEQGVPDEDIADMKTYYEYMDSEECGGLPTYTLMKYVELFED